MKAKNKNKKSYFLRNMDSEEMREIHSILSKLNVDIYLPGDKLPKDKKECTFITDKDHNQSTIINLLEELTLESLYLAGVIKYHPGDFLTKSTVVYQNNSMGGGWFIDYGDFSAFYPIPNKIVKLFEDKVDTTGSYVSGWRYKEDREEKQKRFSSFSF